MYTWISHPDLHSFFWLVDSLDVINVVVAVPSLPFSSHLHLLHTHLDWESGFESEKLTRDANLQQLHGIRASHISHVQSGDTCIQSSHIHVIRKETMLSIYVMRRKQWFVLLPSDPLKEAPSKTSTLLALVWLPMGEMRGASEAMDSSRRPSTQIWQRLSTLCGIRYRTCCLIDFDTNWSRLEWKKQWTNETE